MLLAVQASCISPGEESYTEAVLYMPVKLSQQKKRMRVGTSVS